MTIFSSSPIFGPVTKFIRFFGNKINVVSGANTISSLPLCNVKIDYKQYQRLSIQVPAGQEEYVLSFSMLGIKPTFLAVVPTYSSAATSTRTNFLKWKYESSSDAKGSFTTILVLTGTSSNPIPTIVLDNPNPNCNVQLEILVGAMDNDYLNDISALLYLNNLEFNDIQTYNQTTSQILAYYNSDNELSGTTNLADIINVSKIPGQNRLVIDDASANNIVLDFISEYHALQALSAINWLLLDPINRLLPKAADILPPVINYTVDVVLDQITIDLVLYPGQVFTKQDFIDYALLNATDLTDGNIAILINNIVFKQGTTIIPNIINVGTFNAYISISDIAGNTSTNMITIDAQLNIIDITPPVITFTNSVVIDEITIVLADYLNNFTYNDAKVLCILSIIDDIDGPISLSNLSVSFVDILSAPVAIISTFGPYIVTFIVSDLAGNTTTRIITLTAS